MFGKSEKYPDESPAWLKTKSDALKQLCHPVRYFKPAAFCGAGRQAPEASEGALTESLAAGEEPGCSGGQTFGFSPLP